MFNVNWVYPSHTSKAYSKIGRINIFALTFDNLIQNIFFLVLIPLMTLVCTRSVYDYTILH